MRVRGWARACLRVRARLRLFVCARASVVASEHVHHVCTRVIVRNCSLGVCSCMCLFICLIVRTTYVCARTTYMCAPTYVRACLRECVRACVRACMCVQV